MNVLFFDLSRMYLEQKKEIDDAVARVLASGHFILGKALSTFEADLKKDLSAPGEVVGCNSGTDALVLSMLVSGVGPGDEVLVPSHTAIPTITAIRLTGASPVFIDIDSESWLIDLAELRNFITPKTKAVIPVHLYGNMADIPAVSAGTRLSVIEDVAQAQGSLWNGRQAGTLGRFGAYSFYPTKNIGALGDGGAIYAAGANDIERLKMLRNYGQRDRYNAEIDRGVNSRLDEIQAAILSVKLKRMHQWNKRKTALVDRYRAELKDLPLRFQKVSRECQPAWHLCVARAESRSVRDGVMEHLSKNGVQTLIHYPLPTHTQKAFSAFKTRALPRTEALAETIFSLPMNPILTDDEQSYVIEKLRTYF